MSIDKRLYWDSVAFIDFIEQTPGRIDKLQPVVEAAKLGDVLLITSAFTMVEVVKLTNLNLLDEQVEQLVTEFFENPYIAVRNLDRFVSEKARPIVRQFGLKPPDAVHVATALLMKADVLHTFDHRHLIPLSGKIEGLRIEEPPDP
jgi:predicted nucleic acid-binding protein